MKLAVSVMLLLSILTVGVGDGGEGAPDLLSATEQELLSSQLWKENVASLFMVRQSKQLCMQLAMYIYIMSLINRCQSHSN